MKRTAKKLSQRASKAKRAAVSKIKGAAQKVRSAAKEKSGAMSRTKTGAKRAVPTLPTNAGNQASQAHSNLVKIARKAGTAVGKVERLVKEAVGTVRNSIG
jgi:hypothetical protein